MKLELKHLAPYLLHKPFCSYLEYKGEKKRLKARLTGLSRTEGVETTYNRKRRGCSGDYIQFEGNNNVNDLEFKLHLHPLSSLTKPIKVEGYNDGKEFVPVEKLYEGTMDEWQRDKETHGAFYDYVVEMHEHDLVNELTYSQVCLLQSWHFAIDLPEGTWIDINTLNK